MKAILIHRDSDGICCGEPRGLVWDVLQGAFRGTLEAPGENVWTLAFAALCAAGLWWRQCRREGRGFWSFPLGWKQSVADTAFVTIGALVVLFVPQLIGAIYDRDAAQQAAITSLRQELARAPGVQTGVPVVPENPDHANLVNQLDAVRGQLATRDRELIDAKLQSASKDSQIAAFEARVRELERDLAASRQRAESERSRAEDFQRKLAAASTQQTQCDQLAVLSANGRQLVQKLFATRAAPETRREIDGWYSAVCGAMSKNQCEAFLSAPRARDVWANYPFDDGGYQQTLRGRSEYLSAQLSRLCR